MHHIATCVAHQYSGILFKLLVRVCEACKNAVRVLLLAVFRFLAIYTYTTVNICQLLGPHAMSVNNMCTPFANTLGKNHMPAIRHVAE